MSSTFLPLAGIGAAIAYLRARAALHASVHAAPVAASATLCVAEAAPAPLDPNLPIDAEGRIYHLQICAGELSPRILSVGDTGRAERIAALFDEGAPRLRVVSSRGFVTHTGFFKGVRVSVIATGMGCAMMDFVVRECRALLDGPMAILRYGTCGGLRETPAGAVAIARDGAVLIRRDVDVVVGSGGGGCAVGSGGGGCAGVSTMSSTQELPYVVSRVVMPDARLAEMVRACVRVRACMGGERRMLPRLCVSECCGTPIPSLPPPPSPSTRST